MTLYDLEQGEKGIIAKVRGRGAFRKRITEMGFVKGKVVTVIKKAPLRDPIEYNIMGYELLLRQSEARLVEVITAKEAKKIQYPNNEFSGVIDEKLLKTTARTKGNVIDVALVGNPNSGKTTIFNYASGSKEHVGNYSGVTVDSKQAKVKLNDYTFNIIDLPGTYSLSAYSPEELYVRKYILGFHPDEDTPIPWVMMKYFHIRLAGSVIVVVQSKENWLFLNLTGNIRRSCFWNSTKALMWSIYIIIFHI